MNKKDLISYKGNLLLGVTIIEQEYFKDNRGIFFESWNKNKLNKLLSKDLNFVQDNISISHKGVIRGLHYQLDPQAQGKLVRCLEGTIFDVVVDLRFNSKTFGEWEEYHSINWKKVYALMRKPAWLFDSRSIANYQDIKQTKLNFWRIGDGTLF